MNTNSLFTTILIIIFSISPLFARRGSLGRIARVDQATADSLGIVMATADVSEIANYLEAGANPNVKLNDSSTPFFNILRDSLLDEASLMIEAGADVNSRIFNNKTPLLITLLKYGNESSARFLLDNGAEVLSDTYNYPSHIILNGTIEFFEYLIETRRFDFTRSFTSGHRGEYNLIGMLLIKSNYRLTTEENVGQKIQWLIDNGVDVNFPITMGFNEYILTVSPILITTAPSSILRILLDNGLDVECDLETISIEDSIINRIDFGMSIAVERSNEDLQYALEKGVSPNDRAIIVVEGDTVAIVPYIAELVFKNNREKMESVLQYSVDFSAPVFRRDTLNYGDYSSISIPPVESTTLRNYIEMNATSPMIDLINRYSPELELQYWCEDTINQVLGTWLLVNEDEGEHFMIRFDESMNSHMYDRGDLETTMRYSICGDEITIADGELGTIEFNMDTLVIVSQNSRTKMTPVEFTFTEEEHGSGKLLCDKAFINATSIMRSLGSYREEYGVLPSSIEILETYWEEKYWDIKSETDNLQYGLITDSETSSYRLVVTLKNSDALKGISEGNYLEIDGSSGTISYSDKTFLLYLPTQGKIDYHKIVL